MKKIFTVLILVSLFIPLFSLFSFANEDEPLKYDPSKYPKSGTVELDVYNWGEYMSLGADGTPNSNELFEAYCKKKFGINVKVNYTTYDNNENMYSKLKSGAVSYDIVIPSDYMIEKMASEGMLLEFDAASIPAFENLDENFTGLYYDRENQYSVAYTYGMVGIIYNTELVDEADAKRQSWDLLWNDKYRCKILQFNNPRDAFATAMYKEGLDVNSDDGAVWAEALEVLKEQKPLLQGYVNDEVFNKMEGSSAAIAPYYAGDFLTMSANNDALDFYYPTEGTNYFVDAMCIPKSSKNPYLAMEYINFMLTVDGENAEDSAAIANALYIGYATPNKAVRENDYYVDTLTSEDWYGERAMDILYGCDPAVHNSAYAKAIGKEGFEREAACYKSFSPEIQNHVNKLWEELKTESSTEPWIHAVCIVIVAGVLSLAVYTTVVKKIRSKDYRLRDKEAKKARK